MAMTVGNVTVADDGAVTKSHAAGAVYDALVLALSDVLSFTIPGGPDGAKYKKGLAIQARAVAALVAYVQANGQAKVATTSTALQRTPNPNNPDTDTQGPSADKFLAIV